MLDARAREARFEQRVEARGPSAFQRLSPAACWSDDPLAAIEHALDEPAFADAVDEAERTGEYPRAAIARLHALGLAWVFADPPGGTPASRATVLHGAALGALAARRSGSLAVVLGVTTLGLIPVHAAASPALLEEVRRRVGDGARAALMLTERAHGSNLVATDVRAEPDGDGYRLFGEKDLVNGATEHEILVVLARVRPHGERPNPADLGLFVVTRDERATPLARWRTLPVRAADISGVRFDGTRVPAGQRLGRGDDAFAVVQKTLVMTRGGVAAFASGAASGALDVARAYAGRRAIWGVPTRTHGAIADHLVRMEARDLAVAAVAVKASAMTNLLGDAAALSTAVAKLAGSLLAEEAVTEGRRVLGSRALLCDGAYERFVRDVVVYGAFDGSTHLMLDQLQWRLAQIATREGRDGADPLAVTRAAYTAPPRPLAEVCRMRRRVHLPDLEDHARALERLGGAVSVAPLEIVARGLVATTRALRASRAWVVDQGVRFEAAEILALFETAVALVEVADPDRRAALGLAGPADAPGRHPHAWRAAVGLVGARAAQRLRALAFRAGSGPVEGVDEAERAFWILEEQGRVPLVARDGEVET